MLSSLSQSYRDAIDCKLRKLGVRWKARNPALDRYAIVYVSRIGYYTSELTSIYTSSRGYIVGL